MARVMAQGDFRPMADNRGAMGDLKAILAARGADYARADARVETSGVGAEQALARLIDCARTLLGNG
jgi:XRE family aerobic/anaerobic benzoate catabolism transcriptional regulator